MKIRQLRLSKQLRYESDRMVYNLFDLTPEEIEIVENSVK
jgi:hypothetical protein